ncbi:MAG: hypothetical protein WBD09_09215 [Halobacteriota archaeon]
MEMSILEGKRRDLKNLGGDKKMKAKIVAGTIIALIAVAGIALVVSSTQLYPKTPEAVEVECEGCETIDRPSDIEPLDVYNGRIEDYSSGQSDCEGRTEDWNTAVCLHNTIIRWSGESEHAVDFWDSVSKCYWRWDPDHPTEWCYPEWADGRQDLDVHLVTIANNDIPFGHSVCGEYKGGGMEDFDNWRFFQYNDGDINPGEWQMPCGTDNENTKVRVKSVFSISCRSGGSEPVIAAWEMDKNCDVSSRVVGLPSDTKDEDTTWINAEIEDLEKKPEMQIAAWMIDIGEKEVDIWVYELTLENQQLDDTMIGEWKVNVWEDQKPPE